MLESSPEHAVAAQWPLSWSNGQNEFAPLLPCSFCLHCRISIPSCGAGCAFASAFVNSTDKAFVKSCTMQLRSEAALNTGTPGVGHGSPMA